MNPESSIKPFTDHLGLLATLLLAIVTISILILILTRIINKKVFQKISKIVIILALVLACIAVYWVLSLKSSNAIEVKAVAFHKAADYPYGLEERIRPSTFGIDDGGMGDHPVNIYIADLSGNNHIFDNPDKLRDLLNERKDKPLASFEYFARVLDKESEIEGDKTKKVTKRLSYTVKEEDLKRLNILDKYFEGIKKYEKDLDEFIKNSKEK